MSSAPPMRPGRGWGFVARLGLAQIAIGAVAAIMTSTLNRVMVVELALPATTFLILNDQQDPVTAAGDLGIFDTYPFRKHFDFFQNPVSDIEFQIAVIRTKRIRQDRCISRQKT